MENLYNNGSSFNFDQYHYFYDKKENVWLECEEDIDVWSNENKTCYNVVGRKSNAEVLQMVNKA